MENYTIIQDLLQIDESDPDIEIETEDQAPEQEAAAFENEIEKAQIHPTIHLDYKLKTCAEREALVEDIIAKTPKEQLTNRYLEILGDYIMGGISKEEKKARLYLTDNRRITIERRETSFEGLISKFENGEDGIYSLITNDKNVIFQHKQEITEEDIKTIPGLKELRAAIERTEEQCKAATGRRKYLLKKQLIEMRRDQYALKNSVHPIVFSNPAPKGSSKISLSGRRYVDDAGEPQTTEPISFFNPAHISAILCHYNALKIETDGNTESDFYYLMQDFDKLLSKALKNYPSYLDIVFMKINNKSNVEIQEMLIQKYNIKHTIQYISQLWRTKIPKIIAEKEQHDFLIWWYAQKDGSKMKRCACCKQLKPANARFFTRNCTSKDGFYSWCKECRSAKNKK